MGDNSFTVDLLLRDHRGRFIIGKFKRLKMVSSVLEAEAAAISEGIQWLLSLLYHNVQIESDSLMSVQAINHAHDNALEVGFVLDECHGAIILILPCIITI